jgi:hypothetical protein
VSRNKLIAFMVLATLIRWAPFLVIVALLVLCLTGCGAADRYGTATEQVDALIDEARSAGYHGGAPDKDLRDNLLARLGAAT